MEACKGLFCMVIQHDGDSFSSKLDWGSYTISIAKTVSKKIGALIHSMNFLSPDVSLSLNLPLALH